MLKVISFKICPFVQRVTGLLAAKNIPFEVQYINLKDKPQWFLEISPNGQVPLLITESGTAIFESDAIVEYIEEAYGAIEAKLSPEQKAIDRAWSYQASKHYLVQCSTMRSQDKETLIQRSEKLYKLFEKAEKVLTGTKFFKGDNLSKIDIAWLPLLHRAAIINKRVCHNFLAGFPKVATWQQNMMALDIIKSSVSDDFEQAFSQFYLSDQTYLGSSQKVSENKTCETNCCG